MTSTDWRNARVLVTGARGFIGTRLCQRLLHAGARVTGVSSTVVTPTNDIEWVRSDLADLQGIRSLVDDVQPELVFHLAGHVTGSQDPGNIAPTFSLNLGSTVHLLTALVQAGSRPIMLVGSMHENDDLRADAVVCSPYAAAKTACAIYARMFHGLYGLPVSIARPMMVYGPGQWDTTKLLPYVITSFLAGVSPAVTAGTRELDWVYVDDVVDAFLTIASTSAGVGRAIELGSGTLTTVRDLVLQVGTLIDPQLPVRFGAMAERKLERPRAARVEETKNLIGWRATTPLQQGLAATIAWHQELCSSPKPV
jgi:nucleoside-diphosphate-sugar epimerase